MYPSARSRRTPSRSCACDVRGPGDDASTVGAAGRLRGPFIQGTDHERPHREDDDARADDEEAARPTGERQKCEKRERGRRSHAPAPVGADGDDLPPTAYAVVTRSRCHASRDGARIAAGLGLARQKGWLWATPALVLLRIGPMSTRRKAQALAIKLSRQRRSGQEIPAPPKGRYSERTREKALRDLEVGRTNRARKKRQRDRKR
jgi:hypothetical protein